MVAAKQSESKEEYPIFVQVPAGLPTWLNAHQLYLVHLVVDWQIRGHYTHKKEPNQKVPLFSGFLLEMVGSRYSTFLKPLVEAGILKTDNKYKVGNHVFENGQWTYVKGRCKHYQLGDEYAKREHVVRQLRNPDLIATVAAGKQKDRDAVKDPLHLQLRDVVDAVQFYGLPAYSDLPPCKDPRAELAMRGILARLKAGVTWFKVDGPGRVHTPVTSLPAEWRAALRVGEYREWSVADVSCCQPVLLADRIIESLLKQDRNGKSKGGKGKSKGRDSPIVSTLENTLSMLTAVRFLEDCLENRLYDLLVADILKDPAMKRKYTRDSIKSRTLAVIYGEERDGDTQVGRAIEARYPGLRAAIYALGDGSTRARAIQATEAEIMIRGAARAFLSQFPGIPILTVHDALVVPKGYEAQAEGCIRTAWQEKLGLEPTIKTKRWG